MRRVVLLGLAVAVAVVIGFGMATRHDTRRALVEVDAQAAASPSPAATGPVATLSPTSAGQSTGPRSAGQQPRDRLAGGPLARAWLTAYLSRPTRDDEAWEEAITPLSTTDLVSDLRSAGPDLVGLEELSSWRVMKVEPYELLDSSLDTESRQTLAYAATVTDGRRTAEKPFELYAYRQDDGGWLVGMVDQPYSSEG